MENKTFEIGDKVTFTNEYGVKFPGKTVVGTETWEGSDEVRYFYTPSDSPWFSVPGKQLTLEN